MIEPAGLIFKFCLEKSPNSLSAQLGQSCFLFFSGNFRAALQGFQSILKANPQFNEIRSAIGYCFQRLGFTEMAVKAFTRVLQIDPKNEAAMLALGFLQLGCSNSTTGPDSSSNLQSGLLQMKRVFELNRSNAVAQIHLANHFFFKKDLVKAKTLAEGALANAPSDKIKAEAYFILAKISHVSGYFSEALGNYQLASKLSPDFLPALYGLGQCFLARGDLDGASMMFERILESEPNCPEVVRLMTLIQCAKISQSSSEELLVQKTLIFLPKALALFPKDELLLQCAAVLFEAVDPQKSVEFYTAANAEESQNFAVLNNFVVLRQQNLKLLKTDLSVHREILGKAQTLTTDKTLLLYMKFNEARLLEDAEDSLQEAERLYKEILLSSPNFPLAHLRLGCINFRRAKYAEAADHFKDVLGADDQNRDAWNCVAATNLKQKAFNPARKAFERVLQNIDKNDPYALVALGNIYVELALQDKAHKHTDDYHKRAGEFYCKALNMDKGNFYAAQGLGVIFADRGMPAEAREIFTQVRAASNNSIDSTLNQAHALVEVGKYASAATLYVAVLENQKSTTLQSGKMVSLLLYLCRARYLLALDSSDYKAADLGICDARKALELLPREEPLKFNLGLLLQARATAIRNSQQAEAVELLDSAIEDIKEAEIIFTEIVNETSSKMDSKLVTARLSLCPQLVKGIRNHVAQTEKSVKDQTNRLEQLKLQREIQALKESEIQARKSEQERLRLAEIERNRKELFLKMRETEEKVKAASSYSTKSSSKKERDSDTEESGNDGEGSEKQQTIKTGRGKKRVKTVEYSEDDELDGITKSRRRRNKISSSVPLLSKEFISSSSENEEEDFDEKALMDTE